VFENRVLRRIFVFKRNEVAGNPKNYILKEELHSLYSLLYIVRKIKAKG
jgi:hypothetical protein